MKIDDDPNYAHLASILEDAYEQAAYGKGRERHARGQPFEKQHMQTISDLLASPNGCAFQAIKKLTEALSMPDPDAQYRELLGVIVYVAGLALWLERQRTPKPAK